MSETVLARPSRFRSPTKPGKPVNRLAAISKVAANNARVGSEDSLLPAKAIIVYRKDFNIPDFHQKVLNTLSNQSKKIPELQSRYQALYEKSLTSQTLVQRNCTLKEMARLKERMDGMDAERKKDYLSEVEGIVSEYKSLGARSVRALETNDNEQQGDERRSQLIASYLQIASRYIPIEYIRDIPYIETCESCGANLSDTPSYLGLSACPNCFALKRSIVLSSNKNQGPKGLARGDYEDRENFYKAYLRYQCRIPFTPPKGLYAALDAHFKERNYPTSDVVKALPLDSKGRKPGTDLDLLFKALHDTGYNDLYKNYRVITRDYWGWSVANYSHLDALIMKDYDATQVVFSGLERERSSSLSTELRVYLHIKIYVDDIQFDSFKIPGDISSMEEQRKLWRKMCEGAKIEPIPF